MMKDVRASATDADGTARQGTARQGAARNSPRTAAGLIALGTAAFILFILDLVLGSVRIPLSDFFAVLRGQSSGSAGAIILLFRLPKAVVALGAGAALAASGLLLQTVFHNPLAGPDVLGINSGASIGVALMVLLSGTTGSASLLAGLDIAGYALVCLAASIGAALILILILILARHFEDAVSLLILGMLVGYLAGSVVSLLVYFADPHRVQAYLSWTYGSFSGLTLEMLPVFLCFTAFGFLLLIRTSKPLDALLLGERYAASLGVDVRHERGRIILAAAVLSGTATAFCGPIAFAGIAAPIAAKRIFRTSRHSFLIPASALVGSCFCLAADILSQLPPGGAVIPVNPLLALVGAPIIIGAFISGRRERAA